MQLHNYNLCNLGSLILSRKNCSIVTQTCSSNAKRLLSAHRKNVENLELWKTRIESIPKSSVGIHASYLKKYSKADIIELTDVEDVTKAGYTYRVAITVVLIKPHYVFICQPKSKFIFYNRHMVMVLTKITSN